MYTPCVAIEKTQSILQLPKAHIVKTVFDNCEITLG